MKELFDEVGQKASKMVTKNYSTSFSIGISLLSQQIQKPIYSIYGFVRFADEIVDTFHDYDKADLFYRFKEDTYRALEDKISLNPILNSFQWAVNKYNIEHELIETFLKSMEMDLSMNNYVEGEYEEYILGSAEVVGLMCLKVFVHGDEKKYQELKPYAMALGSAFQKVNFLRDLRADFHALGRSYFPELNTIHDFDENTKKEIIEDIEKDFYKGYEGILKLPKNSRFGVYVAYIYYKNLLMKIKKTPAEKIADTRIRIPNQKKYRIFLASYVRHKANLI
ncbi:MAG: phytoene/squalene synthase family protein [Crocinitomicaceae bacterium]